MFSTTWFENCLFSSCICKTVCGFVNDVGTIWKWSGCAILDTVSFPISWASQAGLVIKNLPDSAGNIRDLGLIPGSGRSPGGGHGNPLQCPYLENPMDRGAWRATVHRATQRDESECRSVVSNSLRPHELYSPWDSPGQNT